MPSSSRSTASLGVKALTRSVTERVTKLDIALDLLGQHFGEDAHDASPGKGSATSASCGSATFTYMAVVTLLRWPRRSATSLIGCRCLTSCVARLWRNRWAPAARGSSIPLRSNRDRTILEIDAGHLNGRAGGAYDKNTRGLPTFGLACRM